MKPIHHVTITDDVCPQCGKPFKYFWHDKEERNGISETRYTFAEVCFKCATLNIGEKPKSLQQLNKEREDK